MLLSISLCFHSIKLCLSFWLENVTIFLTIGSVDEFQMYVMHKIGLCYHCFWLAYV